MLIARARELMDESATKTFKSTFGRKELTEDQVTTLQDLISDCGALAEIEAQIEALTALALDSLQSPIIESQAREALQLLAVMATQRAA